MYERVQLEFDCSGEAMVFTTDGDPLHGKSLPFFILQIPETALIYQA
jgi:hypothetical protein